MGITLGTGEIRLHNVIIRMLLIFHISEADLKESRFYLQYRKVLCLLKIGNRKSVTDIANYIV